MYILFPIRESFSYLYPRPIKMSKGWFLNSFIDEKIKMKTTSLLAMRRHAAGEIGNRKDSYKFCL